MPRQAFDKSSKWLLQHYGKGILLLGGVHDVWGCRAVQAEVVQPRQLPDGLLEVTLKGQRKPYYVVVEVETYASKKVEEQAVDDLMLVYQDRRVVPEVLVVVLRPKGNVVVAAGREQKSLLGLAGFKVEWRVVELWKKKAEDLLAVDELGLVPWVPLAEFDGPPEKILHECRDRIERRAPHQDQVNLLAVTQVLARLRFPAPRLLEILGGKKIMIESPLLKELMAEARQEGHQEGRQEALIRFLRARFRTVSETLATRLRAIHDEAQLDALIEQAAVCPSLAKFRERLPAQ